MEATTHNSVPVLATIGVDIGKGIFHVVGFSQDGKIAPRRKIKRLDLVATFKKSPPRIVGMEAALARISLVGRRGRSAMSHASFPRSTSSPS